jgi:low affinity Fe/Cu permease
MAGAPNAARPAGSESPRAYVADIVRATKPEKGESDLFRRLACAASEQLGSHWAFIAALSLVIGWAASGPLFQFSETWQLVINTGTTIITFLMVFLIQSTQNREAKAVQLKLDELIRSSNARNVFADLEDASDHEIAEFQREFRQLRQRGLAGKDAVVEAHRNVWQRDQESDQDS